MLKFLDCKAVTNSTKGKEKKEKALWEWHHHKQGFYN